MGDKVQIGPELIRPNQIINSMRGLWRSRSEMEMKSRFIQLCMDASTWSMVAILGLGRIQVKGRLLGFVTRIRCEGR